MARSTKRVYSLLQNRPQHRIFLLGRNSRRQFHDYFVTHLPSSSLHPDSRFSAGPRHQLPRAASKPHTPRSPSEPSPAPVQGTSRDTTVVRIPLRSAKHHFGVSVSRGQRPYNEDTYQAGVVDLPAFAKRSPRSITRAPASSPLQAYREKQQNNIDGGTNGDVTAAGGSNGDPQVFYFGVYDGHGGNECSDFLRDSLHKYIEEAALDFDLSSTLRRGTARSSASTATENTKEQSQKQLGSDTSTGDKNSVSPTAKEPNASSNTNQKANTEKALDLEKSLVRSWKDLVGGYFRRFKPAIFAASENKETDISTILTYAFLRADYDFVSAQARKPDSDADSVVSDGPLNASDVLGKPSIQIGGPKRFKGGSTCSIALVSTPTPTPFWNPSTPATVVVAHVGDSRILLCRTSDGLAQPMTTNHHPSNPDEGRRLRRYAGNIVTDSFGEERMSGLANTRAFGDMQSKRVGVSAEPEIRKLDISPAEYSFMVLVSDGISGALSDQEVVDDIKEGKTPEQGARDVVSLATEVSVEGDNATCICIRFGGWERRSEGGLGSLGTRESRDYRRQEAADPRRRR